MNPKHWFLLIALALSVHVSRTQSDEVSQDEAVPDQAAKQNAAQNQQPTDGNAESDTSAGNGGDTETAGSSANQDDGGTNAGAQGESVGGESSNEGNGDASSGGTQAQPETETADDNKNTEEGMYESLFDYVINSLTGSGNKSEEAGTTGDNTASTEESAAPGGADDNRGLTPGEDGAQVLPSDDDAGKASEDSQDKLDDQWITTQGVTTTAANPPLDVDCDKPVDLQDYCSFTDRADNYFNDDTTWQGFRALFVNMDIVYNLMSCPRGEWCLPDMLDVFQDMQETVYGGLLCDESMWECLFDILMLREDCQNDKEFVFVVDMLGLLCSMTDANPMTQEEGVSAKSAKRCFAYTLAALHVTYADFLANDMVDAPPESGVSCQGYGFRMTVSHLCADSNCKGQYDSRKAMDEWERWTWFMVNEDERVEECNYTMPKDVCGPMHGHPLTEPETPLASGVKPPGQYYGGAALVSVSVVTAVALLFLVLGLLFFWKRGRRRGTMYYRAVSDGYEKDLSDEARLLPRASD